MKINKNIIRIISFTIAACVSFVSVTAAEISDENIASYSSTPVFNGIKEDVETFNAALNAAVSASSYYSSSYLPSNIIDGDTSTAWANGYSPSTPQYITLDLGYSYMITKIGFYGRQDGDDAERTAFRIEGSNSDDFENADVLYEKLPGDAPYENTKTEGLFPWNKKEVPVLQEVAVGQVFRYIRFIKNDGNNTVFGLADVEITAEQNVTFLGNGLVSIASSGNNAAYANDGNDETMWYSNARTGEKSYWQMDFGTDIKNYDLENMNIHLGVTSGDEFCNRRFKVMLSDDENFGDYITIYEQGELTKDNLTIDLTSKTENYRYLRIEKTVDNEALAIYEVSVVARDYLGENAAAGKYTYTNTEHFYYPGFNAKMATDEDYDTYWCADECNLPDSPACLIVDLGAVYNINALELQVKTLWGGCDNFKIIAAQDDRFEISAVIYEQTQGDSLTERKVLEFNSEYPARYIKIEKNNSGEVFGVAEIKAFTKDNITGARTAPKYVVVETVEKELPLENVSLGKTVTTSTNNSAYGNYGWYAPEMAVDGLFDTSDGGRWLSGEGNYGGYEKNWIKVDLGSSYELSKLEFQVDGNDGDDGTNVNCNYNVILIAEDGTEEVVYSQGNNVNNSKMTLSFENVKVCRYVMIRSDVVLAGHYPASFGVREIVAYAIIKPSTNVALNKSVSASTSHPTGWYPVERAVDGVYGIDDGERWRGGWGNYGSPDGDWIEVDLGENYNLSYVKFQVSGYSNGVEVNANYDVILTSEDGTQEIIYSQGSTPNTDIITVNFGLNKKTARYIKIKSNVSVNNKNDSCFGVREIEAYVTKEPETEEISRETVYEVPYNGKLRLSAELENTSDTAVKTFIFFVRKENGVLADILNAFNTTVPANSTNYRVEFDLQADKAGRYYGYIWDGESLRPLYRATEIVRFR